MVTAKEVGVRRQDAWQRLAVASTEMDSLLDAAEAARDRWEASCLDAYNNGLTYEEIAAVSQRSRIRISQVLAAERERRGIATAAKKPIRKRTKRADGKSGGNHE